MNMERNQNPAKHTLDLIRATEPAMRYRGGDFEKWQKDAREKLIELLGMPAPAKDDALLIEYEKDEETYHETRFTFRSEEGYFVPAHLLVPKSAKGKVPVAICLQGHSRGMHISLGRPKYPGDEADISGGDRDFAVGALEKGFAALAIEQRGMGECGGTERGPACQLHTMANLLIGRTTIGERVLDISRAIDVLIKHFDAIDPDNIICVGNSGGGTKGGSGGSGFSSGGKAASIAGTVTPGSVSANGKDGFADMDGFEWAKEAVDFLYGKNVINGTDANHFNPGGFVTREEFLKMAVTAFGMYDETAEVNFDDVASGDWFYRFVASAFRRGIVNGTDSARFGAGEKIVREDMSVIIYRAARAAGYSIENGAAEFTDSEMMPEYAAEAVGALNASGIIRGMEDGRFGFGEYSTRAQAAVVIYRLLKTAMTA